MASLVTGSGPSIYELSLFTIPAELTTGTQFIPPNVTFLFSEELYHDNIMFLRFLLYNSVITPCTLW